VPPPLTAISNKHSIPIEVDPVYIPLADLVATVDGGRQGFSAQWWTSLGQNLQQFYGKHSTVLALRICYERPVWMGLNSYLGSPT